MTQPTSQFEITANTPNCHFVTKTTLFSFNIVSAVSAFVERGQQGMNQLEANKSYGEIDLDSTVSKLERYGFRFKRRLDEIELQTHTTNNTIRYSLINVSKGITLLKIIERNPPAQLKPEEVAND